MSQSYAMWTFPNFLNSTQPCNRLIPCHHETQQKYLLVKWEDSRGQNNDKPLNFSSSAYNLCEKVPTPLFLEKRKHFFETMFK
jgi:hypothetical protein